MSEARTHAWMLLSVPPRPARLRDVIAAADAINHAIPTEAELRGSLGWLRAQGLIQREGEAYSLTEAGLALRAECSATRSLTRTWDAVTARLGGSAGLAAPEEELSSREIAAACEAYGKG